MSATIVALFAPLIIEPRDPLSIPPPPVAFVSGADGMPRETKEPSKMGRLRTIRRKLGLAATIGIGVLVGGLSVAARVDEGLRQAPYPVYSGAVGGKTRDPAGVPSTDDETHRLLTRILIELLRIRSNQVVGAATFPIPTTPGGMHDTVR